MIITIITFVIGISSNSSSISSTSSSIIIIIIITSNTSINNISVLVPVSTTIFELFICFLLF